ncbi:hypothetical protein CDD83_9721 [Cordyceps sp. RAO-2017]|nr:hypothetical protein CDD83_9721 [Cordyceps sp. RAO-2017]
MAGRASADGAARHRHRGRRRWPAPPPCPKACVGRAGRSCLACLLAIVWLCSPGRLLLGPAVTSDLIIAHARDGCSTDWASGTKVPARHRPGKATAAGALSTCRQALWRALVVVVVVVVESGWALVGRPGLVVRHVSRLVVGLHLVGYAIGAAKTQQPRRVDTCSRGRIDPVTQDCGLGATLASVPGRTPGPVRELACVAPWTWKGESDGLESRQWPPPPPMACSAAANLSMQAERWKPSRIHGTSPAGNLISFPSSAVAAGTRGHASGYVPGLAASKKIGKRAHVAASRPMYRWSLSAVPSAALRLPRRAHARREVLAYLGSHACLRVSTTTSPPPGTHPGTSLPYLACSFVQPLRLDSPFIQQSNKEIIAISSAPRAPRLDSVRSLRVIHQQQKVSCRLPLPIVVAPHPIPAASESRFSPAASSRILEHILSLILCLLSLAPPSFSSSRLPHAV